MDRVSEEMQAVINRYPSLRDNVHYLICIDRQLATQRLRRDAVQFVKALAMFNQINFKTVGLDNAATVKFAIDHAFYCFDLLFVDEGFQLISKANSTHITGRQLTWVKSIT